MTFEELLARIRARLRTSTVAGGPFELVLRWGTWRLTYELDGCKWAIATSTYLPANLPWQKPFCGIRVKY